MPKLSSAVFDNTGKPYDVTKVLTPDFLFDEKGYQKYSPVYLPITYVLSYAVQFASLSALITHTICWHGREIWNQTKHSFTEEHTSAKAEYRPIRQSDSGVTNTKASNADFHLNIEASPSAEAQRNEEDVHFRLMQRYNDVPLWWYLVTFITMLAIGIFVVE